MIVAPLRARVREAASLIRAGRLVAFPTETVYGLGARADDSAAVARIYRAKGRPPENPSIVHAATSKDAFALALFVSPLARELAARFWPGPLTLVLSVREGAVAQETTAHGPTIALRVPSHPLALELLEALDLPIAAPSANRSTSISPTTAQHVQKSLGDRVDMILDGGRTGFGIESTIVDVSGLTARVLRRGSITLAMLHEVSGDVVDAADIVTQAGERAPSPGTQARHYAPDARLVIVDEASLAEALEGASREGLRAGALLRGRSRSDLGIDSVVTLPADPVSYAAGLYAALHELDEARCDVLFAVDVPKEAPWDAVRDRLQRASHTPP